MRNTPIRYRDIRRSPSGEGVSSPSYTLGVILRMCSSFNQWIRWRLSLAIGGDVKYIASSRPEVSRVRRTIPSSNQRPSGDWIGGWLIPCEHSASKCVPRKNPLRLRMGSVKDIYLVIKILNRLNRRTGKCFLNQTLPIGSYHW